MNEYQTRLINLRVRKVTASNYFTLSSLVEDYDTLVEELMEDKEELKTKENKIMKFEYKGYTLLIEEIKDNKGKTTAIKTSCEDLHPFIYSGGRYNKHNNVSLDFIITEFRDKVDKFLYSKENTIKNQLNILSNTTWQEVMNDILETAKKEETIMTTEQDPDLLLANQFSEAIDNLIEEILPLIDAKNLYYIINLKVKRVFEEFKDTALYGCHYDELRENVISKIRVIKREEDKKKENPVLSEFTKALKDIKRDSEGYSMSELLDKLNTTYYLYGSILNLSLDDVKKKYFELSSK